MLEDVEKCATKVTCSKQELVYLAWLEQLKLLTLVYRRNSDDTILTHKLMRANALSALIPTVSPKSRTWSYQSKLVKQTSLYRVLAKNFSLIFNSLVGINSLKQLLLQSLWISSNKECMLSGPLGNLSSIRKLWISTAHLVTKES